MKSTRKFIETFECRYCGEVYLSEDEVNQCMLECQKGCYCRHKNDAYKVMISSQLAMDIKLNNAKPGVYVVHCSPNHIDEQCLQRFVYCPYCGRKL